MFRRAAVPSSALRALRALIAPASTAAQNQQPQPRKTNSHRIYRTDVALTNIGLLDGE